eukprot:TRINITY_DN269_c1_g1_i1.p4 TRINITY_DN269_c1_g1~~TRINITY_DN269_c1_g1_i1.p4  ORF type:complete len:123 (-),score=8.36 TRINITY_DN269_c1_g1_i1:202-540(-)
MNTSCLIGDTYSRITGRGGCSTCCVYSLLGACCLCAITGSSVRRQVREKYGISRGGGDCCVHCFCGPCAACQEAREVKHRQWQAQTVPPYYQQAPAAAPYPIVAAGMPPPTF